LSLPVLFFPISPVLWVDSKLRDGAKLEMRSVPNFDSIYEYIFNKCDAECQEYSDKTLPMKEALKEASE